MQSACAFRAKKRKIVSLAGEQFCRGGFDVCNEEVGCCVLTRNAPRLLIAVS